MARINILDKSIFSKIAAGEVVERPSSVIKEMVENSIDAKATQITIEIKEGGIQLIKVVDNGIGIDKEDFHKAFLPHATSKICRVEDLSSIATLGFRGEALSSIAAVSKVTLVSKTPDAPIGYTMSIEDGEVQYEHEMGCPQGTTISASDLFYCVPARKKFLKKPKLEEAECTNIVSRLILANPNIAIKYIADDKTIFQSTGTGLKDAIFCVYGKTFVDQMEEIEYDDGQLQIYGFISKPNFIKANRTYQTLIINGRYVLNSQISAAVYKAYEGFLMKGGFPVFIIQMHIPLDKIDVNVHPNKLEVKFDDSSHIFGIILKVVAEKLHHMNHVQKIEENQRKLIEVFGTNDTVYESKPFVEKIEREIPSSTKTPIKEVSILNDRMNSVTRMGQGYTTVDTFPLDNHDVQNNNVTEKYEQTETQAQDRVIADKMNTISKLFDDGENKLRSDNGYFADLTKKIIEQEQLQSDKQEKQEQITNLNIPDYKQIGIVFNTFILIEKGDHLLVIDQHAGHERLLYDQLKQQYNDSEIMIQDLLVPYVMELNPIEYAFLLEHKNAFEKIGIVLDSFGDHAIKISSVPLILKNIDFVEYMNTILKDTQNLSIKKSDMLEDYLARTACRSAVKANDILSKEEVDILIKMLGHEDQVLLCPHGRPIVVDIDKKEMEKWFKRIV